MQATITGFGNRGVSTVVTECCSVPGSMKYMEMHYERYLRARSVPFIIPYSYQNNGTVLYFVLP